MARPLRYDLPTVKRTVFVHPDTAAFIDHWVEESASRSPGQLVDIAVDLLANGVEARPAGAGEGPDALRALGVLPAHRWRSHQTFGKQCETCHMPQKTARKDGCPGGSK